MDKLKKMRGSAVVEGHGVGSGVNAMKFDRHEIRSCFCSEHINRMNY